MKKGNEVVDATMTELVIFLLFGFFLFLGSMSEQIKTSAGEQAPSPSSTHPEAGTIINIVILAMVVFSIIFLVFIAIRYLRERRSRIDGVGKLLVSAYIHALKESGLNPIRETRGAETPMAETRDVESANG